MKKKTFTLILLFISCILLPAQLSGTYFVGTGGWENYNSLSNAGGFFNALNTLGISGNVQVQITTDLPAESGTVALNQWGGGYTVSIVPQTATTKAITLPNCPSNLLFNGTDNLMIDGNFAGAGQFLRFNSACNSSPVLRFSGDCQNIMIRNTIIASNNSTSTVTQGGAILFQTNQVAGSDFVRIHNCLIEDLSGSADLFFGIQFNAPGIATIVDGLEIQRCQFRNINGKGIYIRSSTGYVNGSQLLRNHFFADINITGPGTGWEYSAIQIESGSGHNIRGNWIGGQTASCGGAKLPVVFGLNSDIVSLIRIQQDVPNSIINTIDSNIIRNISFDGNNNTPLSVSLIEAENGNCNIGSIYGNIIGSSLVDANNPLTASITYEENLSSTSNDFRGIYSTSTGNVNIENNVIGGILLEQSTALGVSANIINAVGSSPNIRNNIMDGLPNNIVKQSTGDLRMINVDQASAAFDISGNTIREVTTNTSFNSVLYGIRVINGTGSPSIAGNFIDNILVGPVGTQPRMQAIRSDNPGSVIFDNTITDITALSGYSGILIYGILCQSSSSNIIVRDNHLSGFLAQNSTSISQHITAINLQGSSSFVVDANYITGMRIFSSSNSSFFRGINLNSSGTMSVINNVIMVQNFGQTNDLYWYGIYDISSGTINIWHNTVDIRGNMLGSRRSSCYYRATNSGSRNIQNNIFNNRRTGGTGGHYAMYYSNTGGTMVCNYNLLYAEENPNWLVYYSTNRSLASWQGIGFDGNSPLALVSQNLVDITNGHQLTTAGNDIGNATLGVNIDHDDIARPIGLGFDMGAFEIETSTLLSPLPVELSNFYGECNGENIDLTWITSSETNNDYFSIEKSSDAIVWEEISRVAGAGNSNNHIEYTYTDINHAFITTNYYRLKQTDYNGDFTYHPVISVNCQPPPEQKVCFNVYPNPITEFPLRLQYKGCINGAIKLQLWNSIGQMVLCEEKIVSPYSSVIIVDSLNIVSSGIYILNISSGNETLASFKIIIP